MGFKEKIRPRWDWNPCTATGAWLKFREKIRPRWDWNRIRRWERDALRRGENQTKVGLKLSVVLVLASAHTKRENQTKVGLKYAPFHGEAAVAAEKIRPRWDWNSILSSSLLPPCREKIRPRWDWNFRERFALANFRRWRKSDQGGIEMPKSHARVHGRRVRKSDQGGIEIIILRVIYYMVIYEKIRPRWDWNTSFAPPTSTT